MAAGAGGLIYDFRASPSLPYMARKRCDVGLAASYWLSSVPDSITRQFQLCTLMYISGFLRAVCLSRQGLFLADLSHVLLRLFLQLFSEYTFRLSILLFCAFHFTFHSASINSLFLSDFFSLVRPFLRLFSNFYSSSKFLL